MIDHEICARRVQRTEMNVTTTLAVPTFLALHALQTRLVKHLFVGEDAL
jgi:hypothetical protein